MRRTKRKNTDDLLAEEKRAAAKSVLFHTALQLLSAGALLWLRTIITGSCLLSHVLLALAVLDLLLIPFSFAVLYQRVREIERDELDEARKY